MHHTFIHVKLSEIMQKFNYDAHPMVCCCVDVTYHSPRQPSWFFLEKLTIWPTFRRACSSRPLPPCPHSTLRPTPLLLYDHFFIIMRVMLVLQRHLIVLLSAHAI